MESALPSPPESALSDYYEVIMTHVFIRSAQGCPWSPPYPHLLRLTFYRNAYQRRKGRIAIDPARPWRGEASSTSDFWKKNEIMNASKFEVRVKT